MKFTTISTEWELDNTMKLTLYAFIKLQKHLSELRIQLDKNIPVFKSSLPPPLQSSTKYLRLTLVFM